jgi:hypothetical protein
VPKRLLLGLVALFTLGSMALPAMAYDWSQGLQQGLQVIQRAGSTYNQYKQQTQQQPSQTPVQQQQNTNQNSVQNNQPPTPPPVPMKAEAPSATLTFEQTKEKPTPEQTITYRCSPAMGINPVYCQGQPGLIIGGLKIVGADAADFQLVDDGLSGQTFQFWKEGSATIRFTPSRTGKETAQLITDYRPFYPQCGIQAIPSYNLVGNATKPVVSKIAAKKPIDLNGEWVGKDYDCESRTSEEMVHVTASGNSITATKTTGDRCVPAGNVTFQGTSSGVLSVGSSFPVTWTIGTPQKPASTKSSSNLTINSEDSFSSRGITFTRVRQSLTIYVDEGKWQEVAKGNLSAIVGHVWLELKDGKTNECSTSEPMNDSTSDLSIGWYPTRDRLGAGYSKGTFQNDCHKIKNGNWDVKKTYPITLEQLKRARESIQEWASGGTFRSYFGYNLLTAHCGDFAYFVARESKVPIDLSVFMPGIPTNDQQTRPGAFGQYLEDHGGTLNPNPHH